MVIIDRGGMQENEEEKSGGGSFNGKRISLAVDTDVARARQVSSEEGAVREKVDELMGLLTLLHGPCSMVVSPILAPPILSISAEAELSSIGEVVHPVCLTMQRKPKPVSILARDKYKYEDYNLPRTYCVFDSDTKRASILYGVYNWFRDVEPLVFTFDFERGDKTFKRVDSIGQGIKEIRGKMGYMGTVRLYNAMYLERWPCL